MRARIINIQHTVSPGSLIELPGLTDFLLSWSDDEIFWTSWVDQTAWMRISAGLDTDMHMRIRVTDNSYRITNILVNKVDVEYAVSYENPDSILSPCNCDNLFSPYTGLECALALQQDLADNIICMFGIPIYYFKTDPQAESADMTFKEWGLHNVVDVKKIKLMTTDGSMPSSNPNLTELDFSWQNDWTDLELSKTQFAVAFGDTAIPHSNDFIYIPLQNRLWQVNSAYDEKKENLMWKSTTWRITLTKYDDKTNVNKTDFTDIIDTLTSGTSEKSYESIFGDAEHTEQNIQTGYDELMSPEIAANNLYDIFEGDNIRERANLDEIEVIKLDSNKFICHNNTIIARTLYNFKKDALIYYHPVYSGHSGLLSFIIRLEKEPGVDQSIRLLKLGPIEINLGYDSKEQRFLIGTNDLEPQGQYLETYQTYLIYYVWNRGTHTDELHVLRHTHRSDFPVYLIPNAQYYFEQWTPPISTSYNPDFDYSKKTEAALTNPKMMNDNIVLCGIPGTQLTNLKYYNNIPKDVLNELLRYTTTDKNCVLSDVARMFNSGPGFVTK